MNVPDEEEPSRWIERAELLALVRRDVSISGDESPEAVLAGEPHLLVPVTSAETPPLDLHTYRVRLERWERGGGPRLTGMREFVHALETLAAPTRAVSVEGATTTYVLLLDESMSEVLACVAVDRPSAV